jgi:hypothetical protein
MKKMADTKASQNMAKVKMSANGKAKAKPTAATAEIAGNPASDDKYRIEDGLRTLTRAEEVRSDKALMAKIADHADSQAELMQRAAGMAKRGMISEKQAAKLSEKQDEQGR